ncbi:hypothetical protein [uncultured Bartonella sp.]|uniref:hypothetical protein n=1 Tax=uncultured Bartonella sp. TaxID=104108 RepID=UPI00260AC1A6|nr:hypothetical protein [uncultured Bartonella sp.]
MFISRNLYGLARCIDGNKVLLPLFVLAILVLSTNIVFSQSVSQVINQDRQNDMKSADVTVFVFGYSLLQESDKIIMPMIEDPVESMKRACKKPGHNARQWVYMNAVEQYDNILEEIDKLEKSLSINGRAQSGSIGMRIKKALRERRDIMDKARLLDLSSEVVEARLEVNDGIFDKALIETGGTVASSAFDTFRQANTAKIKSVPSDIRKMMEENCQKDPETEENIIVAP